MKEARGPPAIKETPTNYPQLLDIWKSEFAELRLVYNQSGALEKLSERYNVGISTIRYHLFPSDKKKQLSNPTKNWHYQSSIPSFSRETFNLRRKNYVYFRRHLPEYLEKAFAESGNEPMELSNLAVKLAEASNVKIRPPTILSLCEKIEAETNTPLLVEVSGYQTPHYRFGHESSHCFRY